MPVFQIGMWHWLEQSVLQYASVHILVQRSAQLHIGRTRIDQDGSNDVFIVKDATVPAGSSLEIMSGNKLVVQNDGSNADVVRISCGTGSALDAIVTVLEDV